MFRRKNNEALALWLGDAISTHTIDGLKSRLQQAKVDAKQHRAELKEMNRLAAQYKVSLNAHIASLKAHETARLALAKSATLSPELFSVEQEQIAQSMNTQRASAKQLLAQATTLDGEHNRLFEQYCSTAHSAQELQHAMLQQTWIGKTFPPLKRLVDNAKPAGIVSGIASLYVWIAYLNYFFGMTKAPSLVDTLMIPLESLVLWILGSLIWGFVLSSAFSICLPRKWQDSVTARLALLKAHVQDLFCVSPGVSILESIRYDVELINKEPGEQYSDTISGNAEENFTLSQSDAKKSLRQLKRSLAAENRTIKGIYARGKQLVKVLKKQCAAVVELEKLSCELSREQNLPSTSADIQRFYELSGNAFQEREKAVTQLMKDQQLWCEKAMSERLAKSAPVYAQVLELESLQKEHKQTIADLKSEIQALKQSYVVSKPMPEGAATAALPLALTLAIVISWTVSIVLLITFHYYWRWWLWPFAGALGFLGTAYGLVITLLLIDIAEKGVAKIAEKLAAASAKRYESYFVPFTKDLLKLPGADKLKASLLLGDEKRGR
jgi:hypothetical protein